jgi:general stress protein YciG
MTAQKKRRGFAAMNPDAHKAIAARGGASVPAEKRSFSQDRELASASGRLGGCNVPPEKRSFSRNRLLAAEAGRKGGKS